MVLFQSIALRDFLIHWLNSHSELFKVFIRPDVGIVLHSNNHMGKGEVFHFL